MIRVAICDDNTVHTEEIEAIVESFLNGDAETHCFCGADDLRKAVGEGERFDILFMDIRLADENGITLVGELFPKGCGTQVIYVTAYIDYCTKVYDTEHIWFLTKPVDRDALKSALDKAVGNLTSEIARRIPVRFGGSLKLIAPNDVLYAESEKRRLHIVTANDELLTYQTLRQFADGLDGRFLICHKSYLVNMEHIRSMEADRFTMENGASVPISRNHYAAARRAFLDYIGDKL